MKIKNEIKVGLLAIVAIAALIFGFKFLQGTNIFERGHYLYAVYDNANGISASDGVEFRGYEIGVVDKVERYQDTLFIVRLKIKEDMPIPINSRAEIFSSSLMGGKAVEIILGDSREFAEGGDTLIGGVQPGLTTRVQDEIAPITDQMTVLLDSLALTVSSITGVFNKKNRDNLGKAMSSVPNTLASFNEVALSLQQILVAQQKQIDEVIKNIELITANIENNNEQITGIINNTEEATRQFAEADLKTTIENLKTAVGEIQELVESANDPEGSFNKLLHDPTLYDNLTNASNAVDSLATDFKLHPWRYIPLKWKRHYQE